MGTGRPNHPGVMVVVMIAVLTALACGCGALGAIFQTTTLVWPIAPDPGYRATGWTVSQPFGWIQPASGGAPWFHEAIEVSGAGFCAGCPVVAAIDADVRDIGWRDPLDPSADVVVHLENEGAGIILEYGGLQPYLLHVQLQGRISTGEHDTPYAPLGGVRQPTLSPAWLTTRCDAPVTFVIRALSDATVTYAYDRPVRCVTSVSWAQRDDGWRGWIAEDPPSIDGRASISWSTPAPQNRRVADVALRFRARLIAPPPTVTPTASACDAVDCPSPTPVARQARHRARFESFQPVAPCPREALVALPGVTNAHGTSAGMLLSASAAEQFAAARADVRHQTGRDLLARLADALRAPEFHTTRPGVAFRSWHKAGRAIDLDIGAGWRRVADGRRWRLFIGAVDVTAILERHGWRRIDDRADSPEWWHYEYRTDQLSWADAMRRIWPLPRLRAAFPDMHWPESGCTPVDQPITSAACTAGVPVFDDLVRTIPGCGPPVAIGEPVALLHSVIGYLAETPAPHLRLALRLRGADGQVASTDICTERWLGALSAPVAGPCATDYADPQDFLPRAMGQSPHTEAPVVDGDPYQLPPPDQPGAGFGGASAGSYWSPHARQSGYGGGDAVAALRQWWCDHWYRAPWCT